MGAEDNTYALSFDYSFTDEADLNTMTYFTVRIRPITAPEVKDPAVANTDFGFILSDIKAYVLAQPLVDGKYSGNYSTDIVMPDDSTLPSSVSRAAIDPAYGYDTRIQYDHQSLGLQSTFVSIDVLDSNGTLSTKYISRTKLEATFYSSNRDALIVNDRISGEFTIYNISGQSVLNGEISNSISVETLKSGIYILSTKEGVLKFVK